MPQTTTLTYLVGDHLGSTSLTVNASTGEVVETRYKPWGEVRWTTESKTLPTRYTFTGQYSYIADSATDLTASASFGLMFYNARWYDPALGRMAQADTIVPGGVQGLDRYAYVGNNPVRYTDPSGHKPCDDYDEYGNCITYDTEEFIENAPLPLLTFATGPGQSFTDEEIQTFEAGAQDVAESLAQEINSQCTGEALALGICFLVSPEDAFYATFGGPILVKRVSYSCDCWAEYIHDGRGTFIAIYSNTTTQDILEHPNLIVHEIGHVFLAAAGNIIHGSLGGRNGFFAGRWTWQLGADYADATTNNKEIFADMFVGWVYGKWQLERGSTSLSGNGAAKSAYMDKYMPLMINKAIGR